MLECSFTNQVVVGSNLVAVTQTSDIAPVSNEEFLDIQATIECRFTLKCVRDLIITYSHYQMALAKWSSWGKKYVRLDIILEIFWFSRQAYLKRVDGIVLQSHTIFGCRDPIEERKVGDHLIYLFIFWFKNVT